MMKSPATFSWAHRIHVIYRYVLTKPTHHACMHACICAVFWLCVGCWLLCCILCVVCWWCVLYVGAHKRACILVCWCMLASTILGQHKYTDTHTHTFTLTLTQIHLHTNSRSHIYAHPHTLLLHKITHVHVLQHSQVSGGHQSVCTPHSKRTHSHTHFHRKLPHTFIYSNTHRLAVATSQYVPLTQNAHTHTHTHTFTENYLTRSYTPTLTG